MIKQNKYKIITASLITLLPMIFGLILWEKLPDEIATIFSWNGEINGYSSKAFAVVFLPILLLFINFICIIATSADPRRKNISNKMFSIVISIVPVCSLLCGACIYSNALGYDISVKNIVPLFIGIMFVILGSVLPECKQNYTIGIKLPWTLHSEENWNKTHKIAAILWIFGGDILVVSSILNLTHLFIIIVFALIIIPTIYSYFIYKTGK